MERLAACVALRATSHEGSVLTARRRRAAIVGCGPAGLAAALFLADHLDAVLFDQFDQPAPVGSGLMLQPVGLAALDALGLGERMRRLGQPIARLFGRSAPSGRIALDVSYAARRDGAAGLAVHRAALFRVLMDAAAERGTQIETDAKIVDLERGSDDRPWLIDARGRRHGPFDLVVDAAGAQSALRDAAGLAPSITPLAYGALWTTVRWDPAWREAGRFAEDTLEQRYRRASTMIGVLPVGRQSETRTACRDVLLEPQSRGV